MNRKATHISGIYEYDNGTYFVRITRKCMNGKVIEKSRKAETLAQAIDAKSELSILADRDVEHENKFSLFSPERNFEDYISWYLNELAINGKRKRSVIETDQAVFKNVINPIIGQLKLNQISRQNIYYFLSELSNLKSKRGNPYSNASQKRAYILLKSAVKFALKRGIISSDPTDNIDHKFNSPIPERKKDALNIDQVNEIIVNAKRKYGIAIAAFLAVGFTTGMRMCEISSLEVSDLDFENSTINVRRSVYRNRVSSTTKNGTHNQVPMLPNVADLLKEHIEHRNKSIKTLFYGKKSKGYVSAVVINKILKALCIESGFQVISAHGMRRSLNSILINGNVSPLTTAKILNHKSIGMTFHYYSVSGSMKMIAVQSAFNKANDDK